MTIEEIYQKLVDQGRIGYGKKISQSLLESLFGINYDKKKPMRYMGLYIELQRVIKAHGYIPTNRWCDDKGFWIKDAESYFLKIRRDRDKEERRTNVYIDGCTQILNRDDVDTKTSKHVAHELMVLQTMQYANKSALAKAFG